MSAAQHLHGERSRVIMMRVMIPTSQYSAAQFAKEAAMGHF